MPWYYFFFKSWILSQLFHSSFTFFKKLFSSSSLSAIRVKSSAYLRLLIFLLAVLIPAWDSSSPAFHLMYSLCKWNKLDDDIQPYHTIFPVWNQLVVPCLVVIFASWPTYRFLRRQVRWSGIPISWRIFHSLLGSTVKGFNLVNEAEENVFLEFSCFFYDPKDVGNLISGSSAFSKSTLNIRKFSVHVLLKPSLKNFEHYLASMWNDHNRVVVWTFLGIALLWDWNENWLFQSCGHRWVFQICWHIECSTFTASSFGFEIAQLAFHHLH